MTLLLALFTLLLPLERTSLATGRTSVDKDQNGELEENWRRRSTRGDPNRPFPQPIQLDFQSHKILESGKTLSTHSLKPYRGSRNSRFNRSKTVKVPPDNFQPSGTAGSPHQIRGQEATSSPTDNRVHFISNSEVCPKNRNCLTITKESRKHSEQHFTKKKVIHFNEIFSLARQKATTILADEDFKFYQLINKLNDPGTRIRSRKEDSNYVHEVEINIQNWNNTTSKEYHFRIVTCGTSSCNNTIPSKGYISRGGFKNGDVITIYPLCGPNVLRIPRFQNFMDYLQQGGKTSKFPIPEMGLDYVPCL